MLLKGAKEVRTHDVCKCKTVAESRRSLLDCCSGSQRLCESCPFGVCNHSRRRVSFRHTFRADSAASCCSLPSGVTTCVTSTVTVDTPVTSHSTPLRRPTDPSSLVSYSHRLSHRSAQMCPVVPVAGRSTCSFLARLERTRRRELGRVDKVACRSRGQREDQGRRRNCERVRRIQSISDTSTVKKTNESQALEHSLRCADALFATGGEGAAPRLLLPR